MRNILLIWLIATRALNRVHSLTPHGLKIIQSVRIAYMSAMFRRMMSRTQSADDQKLLHDLANASVDSICDHTLKSIVNYSTSGLMVAHTQTMVVCLYELEHRIFLSDELEKEVVKCIGTKNFRDLRVTLREMIDDLMSCFSPDDQDELNDISSQMGNLVDQLIKSEF